MYILICKIAHFFFTHIEFKHFAQKNGPSLMGEIRPWRSSVKRVLSEKVCVDAADLILKILAAKIIQDAFRRWMFRHTHRTTWHALRQLLIQETDLKELGILQMSYWVRREWTYEPESWLYMLQHERETLSCIIDDVVDKI
jgi:hypothetical protein